jgi:transposase
VKTPILSKICAEYTCPKILEATRYKRSAKSWQSKHAHVVKRIGKVLSICHAQRARIRQLEQQIYGKKSEKSKSSGPKPTNTAGNASQDSKRNRGQQPGTKGHGRVQESQLPAVVELVDFKRESEKYCRSCGDAFADGPDTEDSEEIHVDVKAYRRVIKRKKYKPTCQCKCNAGIVTAPAPAKLIAKGKFGISFWVHILINKYYLQRPLNRILEELRQHHLDLSSGSVTGGLRMIAPLFKPIVEAIVKVNQSEHHWHADETRWMVFAKVEGKHSHRWYLWMFHSETTIVFRVMPTRGKCVPEAHFGVDAWGIISADRFSSYKALLKSERFLIAFCWAHVRRDFLDVARGYEQLGQWAMEWVNRIGNIYHINNQRIESEPDSADFLKWDALLRTAVDEMYLACEEELVKFAEEVTSSRRKTLQSLRVHWSGLILFVKFPWIPMDNNKAERTLRDSTLGRKGFYGSQAVWSAELTADTATIFNTLELWGLNQSQWTQSYLDACAQNGGKAPKNISQFLPWNMSYKKIKALGGDPQKIPKPMLQTQREAQACAIAEENSQKKKLNLSERSLPKGVPKGIAKKSLKLSVKNSNGVSPMAA